jgi:ribose-phosphate pyrophosphokinase
MDKILAGSSNKSLAERLSKVLSMKYSEPPFTKFQDQELHLDLEEPLTGHAIFILQSTSQPANDHLMELLLLADTARRAGAKHVIAIMPYFGYSRQDRKTSLQGPISASLIAMLLEAAGIQRLVTIDLHSPQIEGFFRIGVINLRSLDLFLPVLQSQQNMVIVTPDAGGLVRAREFSQALKCEIAVIDKRRTRANESTARNIIGDIQGKNCLIIDDIIDTGGTLINAAQLLMEKGAISVTACITHAVLSGDAASRIQESQIDKVYISDTIAHHSLPGKFSIISVAEILALSISKLL